MGIGKNRDLKKAKHYLEQSMNDGERDAAVQLGLVFENGIGMEKNTVRAMQWYHISVEFGYPRSRTNFDLLKRNSTRQDWKKANELSRNWLTKK